MEGIFWQLAFGYLDYGSYIMTGLMALAWIVLCHGIVWKKGTRLRNLLHLVALFYLLWLAMTVPKVVFQNNNTILRHSIYAIIELMYVQRFADCHRQARSFLWSSMFAGTCCLWAISGQLQFLTQHFTGDAALSYAVGKLPYLLMVLLALYLRHFNFGDFSSVPKAGHGLVLTGNLSMVVLTAVEIPWMRTDYRIVITLLAGVMCVFVMVLVSIFVIYTMCTEQSEVMALQAEKQRLQSEREMTNITESALEDLRGIRHDLKNQYGYIRMLLQSGRNEDAMAYLEQMSENMPEQLSYVDCGNRSMNTILNMEFAKAKRAGIPVSHQLVVPPVLPFADRDLCSVMANLMDNAIEECSRLGQEGKQDVGLHVEIYPHKSYLFIKCSNDTDRVLLERQKKGLRTTKGDPQFRGYGTRIIAKVAEKYNGCAEYSLEDGKFVAKVILDMMAKGEVK